ncbi:putative aldo/keto reductase [Bimuria novae-zelandiae CBS 107.79]|uniref:Putative aldo/keto reductase n=1 Tax=Bimuria novae-zelandiae CBS 107.79 TaxID=1447943 RepID=A0A6A5VKM7_9PLEO|nr:putative aldo/keto reductase [Bimuria novae-zelandiae CBS 107.79]
MEPIHVNFLLRSITLRRDTDLEARALQTLPLRQLGTDGPRIPAIGFGLMEKGLQILGRALELGETFWDTADIYHGNEKLIGKWFKRTGNRQRIFLTSKGAIKMEGMEFKGIDSSEKYLKVECVESLARLELEYIDLDYAHRLNPHTPVKDTMCGLVEGRIKHINLCEVSSTALRRTVKIAPVAAVQIEYSSFVREVETDTPQNLAATSESWASLLSDTSQGTEVRGKNLPRFNEKNMEANAKFAARFKELADKKHCSARQLVLARLLAQGNIVFPIPGTRKVNYLEDNLKALNVELTREEVAEVKHFLEHNEMQGYRSAEIAKHFAFTDTKTEI